jgi:hypothetical protein
MPLVKDNLNGSTVKAEPVTLDKFYRTLSDAYNRLMDEEKDAAKEASIRFAGDEQAQKNYIES